MAAIAMDNNSEFPSLDGIQRRALELLLSQGSPVSPRGIRTNELLATKFTLRNPRRRCVANATRRWSLAMAIGELCWHLSGSDDLSFIARYAPRWREFSDDDATIAGSCYGKRVFEQRDGEPSQWDRLIDLLRVDPASRRAVLHFEESPIAALRPSLKDVACAITLQFLIRDDAVHAVVYMRSNDVILGLPYDVFLFTMLQEIISTQLGLKLGQYHHFCGSLHLYDRHIDLAERILATEDREWHEMPPMQSVDEINTFVRIEKAIRQGKSYNIEEVSGYWRQLLLALIKHFDKKAIEPGLDVLAGRT
jgi:thymidylate synthase